MKVPDLEVKKTLYVGRVIPAFLLVKDLFKSEVVLYIESPGFWSNTTIFDLVM